MTKALHTLCSSGNCIEFVILH